MRMKRGKYLFLLLFVMVGLFSIQAFAAGSIDVKHDVSLTISYQKGETSLSGATFKIFRVADVDEFGELAATKEFQDYFVSIRGENDEAWKSQAATLEGYVLRDQLTPFASGKTDSKGMLTFSTAEHQLTPGLYLVIGDRHKQGSWRYDASPYFVLLPTQDTGKNEWAYSVETAAKYESSKVPSRDDRSDTINRKVLKVWKDAGHESARPKEIVVQLLCNGHVYDTVTLNAGNNWRYNWYDLDADDRWTVVEKEAKGYVVSVSRSGTTFVVTNTYKPDEPGKPTPEQPSDTPNKPGTPNTPTSGKPNTPGRPSSGGVSNTSKLPQTGQLWWPVPLLVCAGLMCFVIGIVKSRLD